MDGVRCAQQGSETYEGRKFSAAGGEKRAGSVCPETKRPDSHKVVEGENVVEVLVGPTLENALSDGALYQHPSPPVRPAVVDGAKERLSMVYSRPKRKTRGIDGKHVIAGQPFGCIFK